MAQQQDVQKKAKSYLEKYQIEEILGDLITTLSHYQIKNPVIYMIKYLCKYHCTSKELNDNGIRIESQEKIDTPKLCLPFPNFSQHIGPIKKLTKEQFYQLKDKLTDQGNNFRSICKLIQENPKSKSGLFAVDPSSYHIYEDIFEPIIKEKGFSNPTPKDMSFIVNTTIFDDVRPYLEESIFVLRRNIPNTRFGSTLLNRAQHTKELFNLLKQQKIINYQYNYDLTQMAQDDVRKLQINDKLFKKKEPSQPLIINIFKDSRHPEWPNDRMVMQSNDKQSIVWINREDHLKFKFLNNEKQSIIDGFDQCCKMNQYLEQKKMVSFDDKFGFHTVKPQYSGLGITFTLKFKLDQSSMSKIKSNSNNLNSKFSNRVINISTRDKDKYFIIKSERCTGLSMKQYVDQLATMLTILFDGVIKKPDQIHQEKHYGMEEEISITPVESINHIALDIGIKQEELDYFQYHKARLEPKFNLLTQHTLEKLVQEFKEDSNYFQNINKRYIIVRRNLSQRNINLEEIIKLNYEIINDPNLFRLLKLRDSNIQIPSDKVLLSYHHHNISYFVGLNIDDDLIFIFPITQISISQELHKIQKIVDEFKKEYEYAWHNQIGYLTNDNQFLGSGISIVCDFPNISLNSINKIMKDQLRDQINYITFYQPNSIVMHNLNETTIQIYRNLINSILLFQKNQENNSNKIINNYIHYVDCIQNGQLWAPSQECFDIFDDLYTKYIKEHAIESFMSKRVQPKKNYTTIDQESLNLICPPNPNIVSIKCTFYRNFSYAKYYHEMTYAEKCKLKNKYKGLLKHPGLTFGKQHHIELSFQSSPQDFIQQYITNWNLLEEIDKDYKIQRQGNLGFLGPILKTILLEGFQLQITCSQPINQDIAKSYNYEIKEDTIIISNRPCVIDFEMLLIKELL